MPLINTALTLKDLPPPPPGKTGWPWTEQTEPLPERMPDGSEWPRISIVTPSYNQGQFIEETIRSVLLQGYPNVEYIIIDGGSTDNSVEVIKKYDQYLAYWVSESDLGQSHAINKGFEKSTGDYIAWMNSDDCYMPNALHRTFNKYKLEQLDFIYGCTYIGKSINDCTLIKGIGTKRFKLKYLLRFFYNVEYIIPSQSVFVSEKVFKKVGFLDEKLHYCMDLDWFARIALEHPLTYRNPEPICFYRVHSCTKTCDYKAMKAEAIKIAHVYSVHLSIWEQKRLARLILYANIFDEYSSGVRNKCLNELIKTMILVPVESLSDTRFLGILKRVILKGLSFRNTCSKC
ncbi:glycosyl transferase, group 2 family protein [Coleofasciculus chthonoplastes PCC 7420]|uniref:Glycosyl transferase, group 2 family protein n=1 Tax=Coleofasciculus chthonoplastes PCC 7420 TaxID=118168 RepID=B4VS38_9CYAN|nr:glycosyltransferase family 2 protein [Coleofasciculus chthonoplastes]EDX75045.1 glycosyl transferase, group 2 family protein [Coleofasciculus chthonoplastes PCC 7420]